MKLKIYHNTDKAHWPYRYYIADLDSMSDVKAYTNDTLIADYLNEDPSDLEDYEIADYNEALRKATALYEEAVNEYEEEYNNEKKDESED